MLMGLAKKHANQQTQQGNEIMALNSHLSMIHALLVQKKTSDRRERQLAPGLQEVRLRGEW